MKARNFTGRLNLIIGIVLGALMTGGNYHVPFLVAAILLVFTVVALFLSDH